MYNCLDRLGFICQVTSRLTEIEKSDLILLPGVGAFPSAINSLNELKLSSYLCEWAKKGRPILGICLGMQLLGKFSSELKETFGLDIIGGQVNPLSGNLSSHIGWNKIEQITRDPIFSKFSGEYFYFNHSYAFSGNLDVTIAQSFCHRYFPAIMRHGQVVGLQFHPEKSQEVGRELLSAVIEGLCNGS